MSARDHILRAVRANLPAVAAPLPDVPAVVRAFVPPGAGAADDLAARFARAAAASGARVVEGRRGELPALLARAYPDAGRTVSVVPEAGGGGGAAAAQADTVNDMAQTDLFVCEAVLGVAENGALWLPASRLGAHRGALFLATNAAVVLERTAVVADLHAAYARLDAAAEPFGAFVAGPSKTADIEQSLVVGAHGVKSLTVILVGR